MHDEGHTPGLSLARQRQQGGPPLGMLHHCIPLHGEQHSLPGQPATARQVNRLAQNVYTPCNSAQHTAKIAPQVGLFTSHCVQCSRAASARCSVTPAACMTDGNARKADSFRPPSTWPAGPACTSAGAMLRLVHRRGGTAASAGRSWLSRPGPRSPSP